MTWNKYLQNAKQYYRLSIKAFKIMQEIATPLHNEPETDIEAIFH
jgi:hypothetical protein